MLDALAARWFRAFGSAPVHPRLVASLAIESDPALYEALVAAVPAFAVEPRPATLARFLAAVENRPIPAAIPAASLRFVRVGHRFALAPIPPSFFAPESEEPAAA